MSTTQLRTTSSSPVTRDAVQSYGDAVGDHNPVHFDRAFAAAAGFPDTVVHGPLTTAIVIDQIVSQLGADQILNLDLRLRGPVFPGDELTVAPTEWGEGTDGFLVSNQRGERVATGTIITRGGDDE